MNANLSEQNAAELIPQADIVFDCAPLFPERFAMNAECVRQRKPMIEAGVFGLEGQVTTIVPGVTPCLLYPFPERPTAWKRQFPILAPVSAMAGAITAAEGIKLLTGIGQTLQGHCCTSMLAAWRSNGLKSSGDPTAKCADNSAAAECQFIMRRLNVELA